MRNIDFTYLTQPPKRYTFEQERLKLWVESYCKGLTLNLFAGKTKLSVDEIRVDLNPEVKPDFNMDAIRFIKTYDGPKFDTVILDPPYNVRKSREKYMVSGKEYHRGKLKIIKDNLLKILNLKAHVIHCGYDSVGMAAKRGFKKIAICLVCHNGDHNDTICLVERFENHQMEMFENGRTIRR
jgi:hypothetical protein